MNPQSTIILDLLILFGTNMYAKIIRRFKSVENGMKRAISISLCEWLR